MIQNTLAVLRPRPTTIIVFLALILLAPVIYLTFEPERTNYRPGEEQRWLAKTRNYESPLGETLFHTDGNLDVFIGIVARDYFDNYLGILLLAAYYITACSLTILVSNLQPRLTTTPPPT